mgnify:CR=1
MKKILLFVVLSVFLAFSMCYADSDDVELASCNWSPYGAEELHDGGFTVKIMEEAFERSGYDADFSFLPWKRALVGTERGKYDGLFSAYYSEERAEKFYPSDPYASTELVLCARKGFKLSTYDNIKDLSGYLFGVVRGYDNTPAIDDADYIKKDYAKSDLQNLKKLLNNRVDLIVIDKTLAIYQLKNSAALNANLDDVKFLTPAVAKRPIHIMFSRATANGKHLTEKFNAGLKEIKADGTYKNILDEYGFSELN